VLWKYPPWISGAPPGGGSSKMACVQGELGPYLSQPQQRLFVENTTLTAFLRQSSSIPASPVQRLPHYQSPRIQGAHYDRSRGDSERPRADRVKVNFKIARRQTLAEMRCRSGGVARPLAALSCSIGFHHRNLTRSARLGDS
jgi:hypothetical protein